MNLVYNYIVIVYRQVTECGYAYNCIACMFCVVILLLCTDGVLIVPVFKTVLHVYSVYIYCFFFTDGLLNVAVFKSVLYVCSVWLKCYCLQTGY